MQKNRLAKLLTEEDRIDSTDGSLPAISKFTIDQITNVHQTIEAGLLHYAPHLFSQHPYDPLVEIAKLAINTQDDNLKFKCHSKLAEYKYPQVRSIEINAKEDKDINITIEIAGYARQDAPIEIEPEDIEIVEPDPQQSYVDSVLSQANKKQNSLD